VRPTTTTTTTTTALVDDGARGVYDDDARCVRAKREVVMTDAVERSIGDDDDDDDDCDCDSWTDGWMDGWMDGWRDRRLTR
jgi:hypothetical protein